MGTNGHKITETKWQQMFIQSGKQWDHEMILFGC